MTGEINLSELQDAQELASFLLELEYEQFGSELLSGEYDEEVAS